MKDNKKTKTTVIATALALVLALGGTIAWLVSADGTVTNEFDPNRVKVEITETGTDENGVNDSFDIIPGTEQAKDPKISATADCPAYVYAIVKDNTHDLVDYEIAEGWTEATGLTKVVTGKDKDGNEISIDPTEEGVKVYYREVSGTDEDSEHGPWSVLKGDKVSYSSDLTNEDMYEDDGATPLYDDISLVFSAYAVQKTPFNDYAKAWNQVVPVTGVSVSPETLEMKVGDADQQLTATVSPDNAANKNVTWTSSDETVATVDSTGKVHAVGAGTATITVTTEDGSKTDTCEVTVTGPTFGYAVQLHSTDNGTITFWPAMGVNAVNEGVTCGNEHCIHNDSWEEIKANPENYAQCITNGCTKKVELDVTAFNSTELGAPILTTGDGGGALYYGLTANEAKWDYNVTTTPSNPTPTYQETLEKIRNNSVLDSLGANIYLLSKDEIDAVKTTNASRIIYASDGRTIQWWTSTVHPTTHNGIGRAWTVRGSFPDRNGTTPGGWYQVDIGDSKVWSAFGIAPAFSY